MTPREHHRFFAKQLVPTHTFQSPDKMFAELTGPKREAFLMFLWNEAGNAVASPIPHVAVEGGKLAKLDVVGAITSGDKQVVVLSMPPATNPNEAAFIALARGPDGPSVFFLERTRDEAGTGVHPTDAVLAEMRADGSRVNHGFASGLDLEAFKSRVGAALGVSLAGLETSLPQVTAAAFMGSPAGAYAAGGAGPARAGAPVAAASGGHVGGFLATLLLVRAGLPLLSWILYRFGMGALIFPLWPVMKIVYMVLSLTIGVFLLIWLYQVHARRRGQASFSPGMAVGGWFIPLANVILAPLIVRSAWKATVGAGGTLIAFAWWFLWLIEVVLESLRNTPEVVFQLPPAAAELMMTMMSYGVFVTVVAYGLLFYIVRRVNERL